MAIISADWVLFVSNISSRTRLKKAISSGVWVVAIWTSSSEAVFIYGSWGVGFSKVLFVPGVGLEIGMRTSANTRVRFFWSIVLRISRSKSWISPLAVAM